MESTTRLDRLRVKLRPVTLVIYTFSLVLDVLNSTGVTFAIDSISREYHISENESSWALSAYALTFGAFLLISGRLGDVVGHKNIFVLGLLLSALFSALIAGIANDISLFVLRAFQGISAAMTVPTAYALVSVSYSGRARELALSVLGMGIASGSALGMIVGGAVTKSPLGYRALFWISFALSMTFCILSIFLVPPSKANLPLARNLDYIGAVLVTAAMLLIVLGFTEAPGHWRLWSFRNFAAILPITAFSYGTVYLILLTGSQFLVQIQGKSALIASVEYLPFAIVPLIVMPVFGVLHSKVDPKWVITAGEAIVIVGNVLFSRNSFDTTYWRFTFPATILISVGTAAFFVNNINIAVAGAPKADQGLVAGVVQSVSQASVAIAFSISGSFLTGKTPTTLLKGYRNAFYCACGFSGAALLITIALLRKRALAIPDGSSNSSDNQTAAQETKA
ncbi:low affinity ammonium transporter [Trichoderma asperellum]|uniref:Low affinity ammonium transporter n=1 Tax=Trichoderma asperellum TaxID=101201 RepID=A0A6V8R025_TRIAP|nr:low affinity ammonium transporter [Trichoderma asperellum]